MNRAMSWAQLGLLLAATQALLTPALAAAQPHSAAEPSAGENAEALESARTHFKLGVAFFRERNYRAAQIEFRTAYDLSPNYKLLYNLAQACVELHEYANAIGYFTRYLEEGGNELPPARRQEVQTLIRSLQGRLASVSVESNESGADVYVDDTRMGSLPLPNALALSAGRHRLVAKKHGLVNVEAVVDLSAGEQRTIRLDFAPLPTPDAPARASTSIAPADSLRWSTEVVLTGIATGALLAGAATMSLVTLDAEHEYDATRRTLTSPQRLGDLRSDAMTKARITDILWGASLVSAAIGVILFIHDQDEERAPQRADVAVNVTARSATLSIPF